MGRRPGSKPKKQTEQGQHIASVAGQPEKQASQDQQFHAIDGSTLASIRELASALDAMSDDTFYYHVTDQKNDFANWVRHVFGEEKLADRLGEARTRERCLIVLLKYMLRML